MPGGDDDRARPRGAKSRRIPFAQIQRARVSRELALKATERQLNLTATHELARMKKMDAYIAIPRQPQHHRAVRRPGRPDEAGREKNAAGAGPAGARKQSGSCLRWPTPSMAQLAGMSTEAFEDFYFEVCTLDYRKLQPGMKALKALMEKTDRVEIKGPGTDLRFSIKGISAIICGGDRNIPDGEVFSCPVKDSVQGHVTFNAPTIYQSIAFDKIRLGFRDGKIVEATSNQTEKAEQDSRFRSGRALHRRVFARL